MFLYGFGPVLWAGTVQTIELSVLSLAAAVILGLLGAVAKLSANRVLRGIGTAYTTLIRSVPDLVLMLLLFYSIQIWLNEPDRRARHGTRSTSTRSWPACSRSASSTAPTSRKPSAAPSWRCRAASSRRAPPTA